MRLPQVEFLAGLSRQAVRTADGQDVIDTAIGKDFVHASALDYRQ
ncbi:hypothetical protein AAHK20_18195 [Trinickia sp. YCB016]